MQHRLRKRGRKVKSVGTKEGEENEDEWSEKRDVCNVMEMRKTVRRQL